MFSPDKKLIITIVLSTLAVAGSFFLFLKIFGETEKNTREKADIAAEISASEEKRTLLGNAQIMLTQNKDAIARIKNIYVDGDNPVEFIEEIERLARMTHNNLLLDISHAASDEKHLGFEITLEAVEKNTLDFLTLLELLPHKITVTKINFQKLGPESPRAPETESKKNVEKNPDTRLFLAIRVRTQGE